jgi:catechol 2,3-dioxygenase-like lactoylglutathione lyase family enzyme
MRLNHVTLSVSDVEESAAFYRRLGLEQIVAAYPGYARLHAPEGETTLSLHPADSEAGGETHDGCASIHFEVDDVDAAVAQLKARGFEFAVDPVDQPYLWREAILLDPDGHRIFIFNAGDNRLDPPWRLPRPAGA